MAINIKAILMADYRPVLLVNNAMYAIFLTWDKIFLKIHPKNSLLIQITAHNLKSCLPIATYCIYHCICLGNSGHMIS